MDQPHPSQEMNMCGIVHGLLLTAKEQTSPLPTAVGGVRGMARLTNVQNLGQNTETLMLADQTVSSDRT